jgi:hypothetical protein
VSSRSARQVDDLLGTLVPALSQVLSSPPEKMKTRAKDATAVSTTTEPAPNQQSALLCLEILARAFAKAHPERFRESLPLVLKVLLSALSCLPVCSLSSFFRCCRATGLLSLPPLP